MKLISYSLFGTHPKYYEGAKRNIELNKKLLPDWETIIYYHPNMIMEGITGRLEEMGAIMVDISTTNFSSKDSQAYPYFWRFFSFLNDDFAISRDLDSRITPREVEYIRRWEESEKAFFIIRDHPWHAPIPSGLFGISGRVESFVEHFENFLSTRDLIWGTDQEILYEYMQNIDAANICYCGLDREDTYIPRDNKDFFIGMQVDENEQPLAPSAIQALSFLTELNY
jgi:hypothetical protein